MTIKKLLSGVLLGAAALVWSGVGLAEEGAAAPSYSKKGADTCLGCHSDEPALLGIFRTKCWDLHTTPSGVAFPIASLSQPAVERQAHDVRAPAQVLLDLAARIGGDISAAGKIVVSITVVGEAESYIPRNGARPGDSIYVSGFLGDAASGLRSFEKAMGRARTGTRTILSGRFSTRCLRSTWARPCRV